MFFLGFLECGRRWDFIVPCFVCGWYTMIRCGADATQLPYLRWVLMCFEAVSWIWMRGRSHLNSRGFQCGVVGFWFRVEGGVSLSHAKSLSLNRAASFLASLIQKNDNEDQHNYKGKLNNILLIKVRLTPFERHCLFHPANLQKKFILLNARSKKSRFHLCVCLAYLFVSLANWWLDQIFWESPAKLPKLIWAWYLGCFPALPL